MDEEVSLLISPSRDLPSNFHLASSIKSEGFLELKRIISNAWPTVLSYLLQMSISIAVTMTLGRLGEQEIASGALAMMYLNVTGFSLGIGMCTAMDTLCSQAYTAFKEEGNESPGIVGVILQRGLLILTLLAIPVSVIWLTSEQILLLFGQSKELSAAASTLIKLSLPGLLPYYYFEALKKFLQAQGYMSAPLYVLLFAAPFNAGLCYLLVLHPQTAIGFIGAPIATCFTYWTLPILTLLYIRFVGGSECWKGFSKDAFKDWKQFFKLGIPGTAMVCTEWWAFEICALVAGLLGDTALATQSIVMLTCSVFYMLPMGVSVSVINRIGNLLGDKQPNRAKLVAHLAVIISIFTASLNATILLSAKDGWGYMFTNVESIVQLVAKVLPIASLFQVSDGISCVCGGVLRGCGRQRVGAYINIIAYYLIALPMGITLALVYKEELGILGMWWGLCTGLILVAITQLIVLFRTDWNEQMKNCMERLRRSESSEGLLQGHEETEILNDTERQVKEE